IDSLTVSPLGAHSYDLGISPTLLLWTIQISEDSVELDLNEGEAMFNLERVCKVFDAFKVPDSFDPVHALGFVGATINSLLIHWKGISTKRSFTNGSTCRGKFIEIVVATISVTTTMPATKPPFTPSPQDGFTFTSDPTTTVPNFAQIGQENNGALF